MRKEETKQKLTLKKNALRESIKEGAAASASSGLGNSFITPFALALNSSPFQIGLLSSFSGLTSPLAQLWGSKLMEKYTRKKIVLTFILLESLMWLAITYLAILLWKGMLQNYLPHLLIILYSILVAFGGLAYPAWFSWMGDIVPEKARGRYFSKRNEITGAVGVIAVLTAAFFLDIFKTKGLALLGFCILFVLAFTFRFISFTLFKHQYSPKFKLEKGYYFSIFDFLKRFDNFGKFAVYNFFFYFSLMVAGPFFTVYMLKDLGFSYTTFMVVTMSTSVFYLLFVPLAGKFSDKFGNVKLLYISNTLFAFSPLFWLIFKNPLALIATSQLISGIANAAIIIAFTNFTYNAISPQRRGICSAYSNILVGAGIFLGSLTGGLLIKYLSPSFMHPILLVFLISAVLRLLSGFIFLPAIKEEKRVKNLPPLKGDIAHPFKIINVEIGWFKSVFR